MKRSVPLYMISDSSARPSLKLVNAAAAQFQQWTLTCLIVFHSRR